METNGGNGGHQHEVFEKRPSPGTFPNRLDIELCICGVRRWVDQNGAPATPWQFIRLGAKPGENEGAGAELPAPPKSALDGLITCGSCGKPMVLDDTQGDQEACYACQSQCPTPRLHALRAEVLLVRTALQTVLTEENISKVLAVLNDPQRYDAARERSLTRQDVKELGGRPGAPSPGGGQDQGEQGLPGQAHHRDTGLHQESSHLLHLPAAGRQPTGGHAPTGDRPPNGGARLKETVEQPQRRTKIPVSGFCAPPTRQPPGTGRITDLWSDYSSRRTSGITDTGRPPGCNTVGSKVVSMCKKRESVAKLGRIPSPPKRNIKTGAQPAPAYTWIWRISTQKDKP